MNYLIRVLACASLSLSAFASEPASAHSSVYLPSTRAVDGAKAVVLRSAVMETTVTALPSPPALERNRPLQASQFALLLLFLLFLVAVIEFSVRVQSGGKHPGPGKPG